MQCNQEALTSAVDDSPIRLKSKDLVYNCISKGFLVVDKNLLFVHNGEVILCKSECMSDKIYLSC